MTDAVRMLSDTGLTVFEDFVFQSKNGAHQAAPTSILNDPAYSADAPFTASIEQTPNGKPFASAYELGVYLCAQLKHVSRSIVSRDYRVWNWISLYYIDQLAPMVNGSRTLREVPAYVLSKNYEYRRYYRHLVRSSWAAVEVHGTRAQVLLTAMPSKKPPPAPIAVRTDIEMQLTATQEYAESKNLVEAAYSLYFDPKLGRLKKGSTSKGPGTPRRLVAIVNQLDLTYDLLDCPPSSFIQLLPQEFKRFIK